MGVLLEKEKPLKLIQMYIWTIFLLPTFWGFTPGNNSMGQVFFTCFILLFFFMIVIKHHLRIRFPRIFTALFITQAAVYLCTITLGGMTYDSKVSIRDLSDVTRPIFYLFALCVPITIVPHVDNIEKILFTIVVCSLSVVLFDIIKFIPIGQTVLKLYTGLEPGSFNYLRFSGTFCYCYNYGFILLFVLCYSLNFKKHRNIVLISSIVLIILTGSRSILLGMILILLLNGVLLKINPIKKIAIVLSLLILGYCIFLFMSTTQNMLLKDIYDNFEKLIGALSGSTGDGSLNTRSDQLDSAIKNFNQRPLLGAGPLKGSVNPIEIQFGYYLSSWGIIGLSIITSMYVILAYMSYKLLNSNNILFSRIGKMNLFWLIGSLVAGMSTPITDQIRVFEIFYLVEGIIVYLYNRHSVHASKMVDYVTKKEVANY